MKKFFIFMSITVLGISGLTACGSGSNTNSANTNRAPVNSTTSAVNTNSSTANNSMMNNSMNENMNHSNSNSVAMVQDNFWIEAAQGGMAEVELAKIALAKSQNAEIKKFAQTMITDHTKANNELKPLAAKKNVVIPGDVGSKHKSIMEDLNKASGADFDKAYVKAMVDDHEEDVKLFESNSTNSDADIKAFAAKTLPTLKSHLEMIKGIQSKMK